MVQRLELAKMISQLENEHFESIFLKKSNNPDSSKFELSQHSMEKSIFTNSYLLERLSYLQKEGNAFELEVSHIEQLRIQFRKFITKLELSNIGRDNSPQGSLVEHMEMFDFDLEKLSELASSRYTHHQKQRNSIQKELILLRNELDETNAKFAILSQKMTIMQQVISQRFKNSLEVEGYAGETKSEAIERAKKFIHFLKNEDLFNPNNSISIRKTSFNTRGDLGNSNISPNNSFTSENDTHSPFENLGSITILQEPSNFSSM